MKIVQECENVSMWNIASLIRWNLTCVWLYSYTTLTMRERKSRNRRNRKKRMKKNLIFFNIYMSHQTLHDLSFRFEAKKSIFCEFSFVCYSFIRNNIGFKNETILFIYTNLFRAIKYKYFSHCNELNCARIIKTRMFFTWFEFMMALARYGDCLA